MKSIRFLKREGLEIGRLLDLVNSVEDSDLETVTYNAYLVRCMMFKFITECSEQSLKEFKTDLEHSKNRITSEILSKFPKIDDVNMPNEVIYVLSDITNDEYGYEVLELLVNTKTFQQWTNLNIAYNVIKMFKEFVKEPFKVLEINENLPEEEFINKKEFTHYLLKSAILRMPITSKFRKIGDSDAVPF